MSLFFGAYYPEGIRFGYRIDKNNPDPYERVSYIYDAVGMTPAKMDFAADKFNYGSWNSAWFVKNNIPVILSQEGEIVEYLNPDNYLENTQGEDVKEQMSWGSNNNVMAQIPLCYVKRYEDENYQYEIISNKRYDEDYFAYAHTDIDGKIKDNMYFSCFMSGGNYHGSGTKLMSLYNLDVTQGCNFRELVTGAEAIGEHWSIETWSQRELIRTMATLISKSNNSQASFGNGICPGSNSHWSTGYYKDKGQFYGMNNNTSQVKIFHIEGLWGEQACRVLGVISHDGKYYVRMTPTYNIDDVEGYTDTGIEIPTSSGGYISGTYVSKYGMLPKTISGTATTYFTDAFYGNTLQELTAPLLGGECKNTGTLCGITTFNILYDADKEDTFINSHITYV